MASNLNNPLGSAVYMVTIALVISATCWGQSAPQGQVVRYTGMCDASAAVMVDEHTFIVADDELNEFALYQAGRDGPPLASISWDGPLGIDPESDEHPEADIEGAARIGQRIYWIASHGRNKNGKWRENRHQFFAMEISRAGDKFFAVAIGRPYRDLASQMAAAPELRGFGLDRVLNSENEDGKRLAPKKDGLNIEGLAAMADGRALLIALRNPRPNGQALLVPLLNPADVLLEGEEPDFGKPILLDLQLSRHGKQINLSVRSIEYSQRMGRYLIIGGPHDDRKRFALYSWSGRREDRPRRLEAATQMIRAIPGFAPEAMVEYPRQDGVQLLSDDGSLEVPVDSPADCAKGEFKDGTCEAKHLLDPSRKTFRSTRVPLR